MKKIFLSCKECGVRADHVSARFCWSCGAELVNSCTNPGCGAKVSPLLAVCPYCSGLTERGVREMAATTREILNDTANIIAAGCEEGLQNGSFHPEEQAATLLRKLSE